MILNRVFFGSCRSLILATLSGRRTKKGVKAAGHRVLDLAALEDRVLLSASPVGPEFLANSSTTGTQNEAAVAADSNGDFVAVWTSDHSGSAEIFAQRYDRDGVAQGTEFRIDTTTAGTQREASVAMDSDGDFVVVWTSDHAGSEDIYAQRFDAAGVAQGGEFLVNALTIGSQHDPSAAMDANGNFVITWTGDSSGDNDVYGQRFDAAGSPQGGWFRVNATTTDAQHKSSVAMDASGNFVVVWSSPDSDQAGVFAQRYNASGIAQGGEFQVNNFTSKDQTNPVVAMDSSGNFVIAWQSHRQDGVNDGIYVQRYDALGTALGGESQVNATTGGPQRDPAIAIAADGSFVVSWSSAGQDGSDWGIHAREFTATGSARNEFLVNTTRLDQQRFSAVAMDDAGDYIVLWDGSGSSDSDGVFGQRHFASTLTVTTVSDDSDGDTASVAALLADPGSDGAVSLREAIAAANNTPGLDVIGFDIAGSGVLTIRPDSSGSGSGELPAISDAVIIDGYSQLGAARNTLAIGDNAVLRIELDGSQINGDGLRITGEGSTIRGLILNRFDGDAIRITGDGNTIVGNYIGTNAAGTASSQNTGSGVYIINSANNRIGSTAVGDRNVISANNWGAVNIEGGSSTGNIVQGNYIGTNAAGNAALAGNVFNGVWIATGASNNTIGGTGAGAGNVISGHNEQGVEIEDSTSSGNVVQGNFIGTNASGTAALGNGAEGIAIQNAVGTLIGGTSPGAGNLIGGNGAAGIIIAGSFASGNVVQGNFIGTDATGALNLANSGAGVHFANAFEAVTGGADDNTIGGTTAGAGNRIRFNTGDGVWVESNAAAGNAIRGNAIDSNGGLGIDLGTNGVAANDLLDLDGGPNSGQNSPVLNSASAWGGHVTISGAISSTMLTTIEIDFFASLSGDASGRGEAERYLGSATVSTDALGIATFNVTLLGVGGLAGNVISATATDPAGNTSEFGLNVSVTGVNVAPVAAADGYSISEDTPLNSAAPGVLANDSDAEGDSLSAVLVSGPTNGTLILGADGSFTYMPSPNFNGTDSFTYRTNDGVADSNVATVTITVSAVNDAPVAVADSYIVYEDNTLTVPTSGVLANDDDSEGDQLTAAVVTGPVSGILTLNADGSFVYTPNADFSGTDSFTYLANDGTANSNSATVTIQVADVNEAPVASDDSAATSEDVAVGGNVLANDTDADGDSLTTMLVSGPTNGSVALSADGSFSYVPNTDFVGNDSFTYKANDGLANSNPALVTITVKPVNDAPQARADGYAMSEDATLTVPVAGVLANDTDPEADPLKAALVSGPTNGTLMLSADGSFTYMPEPNFNGTTSFTYSASDGVSDSNVATVTIAVNAVNDPPVAVADNYILYEDETLTVATDGLLANDGDSDGDGLAAVLVTGPVSGILTLNADGSFVYTPTPHFSGTDSFTYVANDGTTNSNSATVTIQVTPVNDAPVATNDSFSMSEDEVLSVPAAGVLRNDSDIEAGAEGLIVRLVSGPTNGTVTLNSNGSFVYTPEPNFSGSDSFTYRASDGTARSDVATVTISVSPVNDEPKAVDEQYSISEGASISVLADGVLGNDVDVDGDSLTAVLVTDPASGTMTLNPDGSFQYTPAANFTGTDRFTYRSDDGQTSSAPVTVTIVVRPSVQLPHPPDQVKTDAEPTPETQSPPDPEPDHPGSPQGDSTPPGGGLPSASSPSISGPPTRNHPSGQSAAPQSQRANSIGLNDESTRSRHELGTLSAAERSRNIGGRSQHAVTAQSAPRVLSDFGFIIDAGPLWRDLDELDAIMRVDANLQNLVVGSTVTSAIGVSVGYVIWLLRSGYLISSLLASMPAWRLIDPLPVLDCLRDEDELEGEEDDESLETLIENAHPQGKRIDPSADGFNAAEKRDEPD